MYGDGSTERDDTHIEDIVTGVLGALDLVTRCRQPMFEVINLGESRTISLKEMARSSLRRWGSSRSSSSCRCNPGT
jgi:nucleoside-diphosphate-sugar epimerase